MNFWWVNQKQTYRHEVPGGYMWSPKRNSNGASNRSYDAMRIICPGDVVFSFAGAQIKAVGIAKSYCYEFPKPTEFGNVGDYWEKIGWRVDVGFKQLHHPLRIKEHIDAIRAFLPAQYSPIQPQTGNGNQAYLFDISSDLALALAQLIDRWVIDLVKGNYIMDAPMVDKAAENLLLWEDRIEESITKDVNIPETEKMALIRARVGQGHFRDRVYEIERYCRITKVDRSEYLIASHIKPWRNADNEERLDPENGFMLTPTIDRLFDRGFIGFENDGGLVISPVAHQGSLVKMGIPTNYKFNVGVFSQGQKQYLDWHRNELLLK